MKEHKMCEDCKHFKPSQDWHTPIYQKVHAICGRTSYVTRDYGIRCEVERTQPFYVFDSCGAKARFFEDKQ